MDNFPLIIFLVIGWFIFSNVKAAGKGLSKAAQNSETAKETLAKVHAKIRENAVQAEFETSSEPRNPWNDEASSGQWGDMNPTQRGRERARQKESYPGSNQNSQQSLQQRLEAASKSMGSVRKFKEFKQGSERKMKRQETGRGKDFGLSSRHAPQKDQNRHRRDDWGQKGGEVITSKGLLVLLAFGLIVLYVLSKVSPSDLGF